MIFILEAFHRFWQQNPALLYAITGLLGIACAFHWNIALLGPIVVLAMPLFFPSSYRKQGLCLRLFFALILMASTFFTTVSYYRFPTLSQEGILGNAVVEVVDLSSSTTSFGKRWMYKGTLVAFESEFQNSEIIPTEPPLYHLPITINLTQDAALLRPLAHCSYRLFGRLIESSPGHYMLKVSKETPWFPIAGTWSFAEMRFRAKQFVSAYIQKQITERHAATFLAGIATGDFDDRLMAYEFSRFGLQHIMAISGFHFAIIAAILSVLLRLVCSKKVGTFLLILLLTSYCFFLGSSPSILRAWITIFIALLSFLIEKRGSGLNSLGVATLVVLLMDPLVCRNIGFQFSFIITGAILLFYAWFNGVMQQIFQKRPLSQVVEMDRINQYGYCILAFFRQALALICAVNLIAIPIMLFHFQKFPLLGLAYNLFFPFLVSIAMLFLLFGLIFSCLLPILGDAIHAFNSSYTQFVLSFTYNIPVSFDLTWRVSTLPLEFLLIYLTLAFFLGVCLKHVLEQRQEDLQDFAFI